MRHDLLTGIAFTSGDVFYICAEGSGEAAGREAAGWEAEGWARISGRGTLKCVESYDLARISGSQTLKWPSPRRFGGNGGK